MTDVDTKPAMKWYYKPASIIIALLTMGPLALPLVWKSPVLNRNVKILLTIVMLALTAWLITASVDLAKLVAKDIQNLESVLK